MIHSINHKLMVLGLTATLLFSSASLVTAAQPTNSLNLKSFITSPWTKKKYAALGGILLLVRMFGKEPNPTPLKLNNLSKEFKPKQALDYFTYLLRTIDDLIIGYGGSKQPRYMYIGNMKVKFGQEPYGFLGTIYSHIHPTTDGLRTLRKLREDLIYWINSLNADWQ